MLTVYTLKQCSTCRDATQWLRKEGIQFVEKPIRETPPTLRELKAVLGHYEGNVRKLFNTSGLEYKAKNMKDLLPKLTEDQALAELAGNGSLVKRPFVVGDGVGLVGFSEKAWRPVLG